MLLICAGFTSADAQSISKFAKEKQIELGGSIGISSQTYVSNGEYDNESTTNISFSPYAGYFVTDGFEIGIMPTVSYTKYGGSGHLTDYTIYLAPAYNFDTKSNLYPYVMGFIGYNGVDYSYGSGVTGIAWGGEAGLKIHAFGSGLIKIGLSYELKTLGRGSTTAYEFGSYGNSSGRNGYDLLKLNVGFNVFLH